MRDVAGLSERELARVRGRLVRTATGSHGDWLTNCCRHCSSPSASLAAIGSIDFRFPSSIKPRRYTSPPSTKNPFHSPST